MIHRSAAASLLAGILLLFVSSQSYYYYVTAIDTYDGDMTEEEIKSQIEKMLTLWGNDTDKEEMDEIRKMLLDAASGENNMMEEFLHDIENIDEDIENNPSSKLSYEEKRELMFKHQDDPFNVYERWKWDAQFCNGGVHGVGLTTKIAFNPNMLEIMSGLCEMVVKIGKRMLSLLARESALLSPWNPELFVSHIDLVSICEEVIEDSKEVMGDSHQIGAIVARLNPQTYQIHSIGYTNDYERLWNKREEHKLIPALMVADSYLMEALDPNSSNPYTPYVPELRILTDYLILLFGHPVDVVEGWIGTNKGHTVIYSIGFKTILTTLYTTLTALGGDTKSPDIPEYDDEPTLEKFISQLDIVKFIADMDYSYDTGVTVDDLIAERQQDHGEL